MRLEKYSYLVGKWIASRRFYDTKVVLYKKKEEEKEKRKADFLDRFYESGLCL